MNEIDERSTAADTEPVLAAVAPKPHADRFTASTITDEQLDALYAERDRLRGTLMRFAAECHRRKWSYDPGEGNDGLPRKDPTFDALHRLGDEMYMALHAAVLPSPARATPSAAPESHTGLRGAPGAPGGPR